MQINANGTTLETEIYGPEDGVPLVLIRGLGTQLAHWVPEMYEGLAARGYRTVIFDNRDVGLSQKFPVPGWGTTAADIRARVKNGEDLTPPYTLDDMASDVIGLIDALGFAKAHVFGISMGGGIAQCLAINHSDRLLSATIVMSAASFGTLERVDLLLAEATSREKALERALAEDRVWGSPGFPAGPETITAMAGRAWDRDNDATGINRHLLATMASPDRRPALKGVDLPCLVIHGNDDTLVRPEKGEEIASLIPGAELALIDGMGHVITPTLAPLLIDRLDDFIKRRGRTS